MTSEEVVFWRMAKRMYVEKILSGVPCRRTVGYSVAPSLGKISAVSFSVEFIQFPISEKD